MAIERAKLWKALDRRGRNAPSPEVDSVDTASDERATYRHAFETTAADRDRLAGELSSAKQELDALRSQLETYKHAFETTAADRDRLQELVREIADPLDAGYFRINFKKLAGLDAKETAESFAMEWQGLRDQGRCAELISSMFANAGIRLAFPIPDKSLEPIADYLLANFYAGLSRFDMAQTYVERIKFPASIDGADMLPYDLRQSSRQARYRQLEAIRAGRPMALIVGQMKAASAHFTHAASEIFEIPILRVSIGESVCSLVVPQWVGQIAEGGAITHEHFSATSLNLKALMKGGIRKIWVQTRDPRDSSFSLAAMRREYESVERDMSRGRADEVFVRDTKGLARWLAQWVEAAEAPNDGLKIQFLRFEDVTGDLAGTMHRVFDKHFDTAAERRTEKFLALHRRGKIDRRNFRRGAGGEWRNTYSRETLDQAWEVIPKTVRDLLDLER